MRKIRYFLTVYEEGSISRAAQRERVAQASISVHIQELESEFSIKLFDRSARGVVPTQAGDHFYKLCLDLSRRVRSVQQDDLPPSERSKS